MMVNMPSLIGATFSLFLKPVSAEFHWGRDSMPLAVLIAFTLTTVFTLWSVGWSTGSEPAEFCSAG